MSVEIELNYIGNCIGYPIDIYLERNYVTNTSRVILIDQIELNNIENKVGDKMETFELIGENIKEIKIRDTVVAFDNNYNNYEKLGITLRNFSNPNKLIGFGDLIRYLHENNPTLISATENDIYKHIPSDLPKLMTIDEFHYASMYENSSLPSSQETYQLIAKVLTTKDTTNWKPTQKPNNNWKNWESGNL